MPVLFTFIQTPTYAAAAKWLITDAEQLTIELAICGNPAVGELEAGVRKLRVALPGRGKRGGARVVYYAVVRKGKVYLLDIYAKKVRSALSHAEKNEVRRLTKILEEEE